MCIRDSPEAVHMILLHPVECIADEEVLDLVLAVIKHLGAPVRMLPLPGAVSYTHLYGEKSDVVLACQERLKELGYLTTTPDGAYGEDTVCLLYTSRCV